MKRAEEGRKYVSGEQKTLKPSYTINPPKEQTRTHENKFISPRTILFVDQQVVHLLPHPWLVEISEVGKEKPEYQKFASCSSTM
jgi:hypothetical protein